MEFSLVDRSNYGDLLKALECRLPKSAMAHNLVKLIMNGQHPPSISTKVFAYAGKIEEKEAGEEIFIAIQEQQQIPNDYAFVVSPPKVVTQSMKTAFESLVDWSLSICFCATEVPFSQYVAELCTKHGNLIDVDRCEMMVMSLEKARSIQLPEIKNNVEVISLSPLDAELVAKRWKFANSNSVKLLETRIQYVGSAGVKLDGKLVSWVVIFEIGSINALYTEDDYRGQGFAALTMKKICQVAAQKGLVPNVQIAMGNKPSKSLMSKIGFVDSHLIEWVSFRP